jgi:hypothetical protein
MWSLTLKGTTMLIKRVNKQLFDVFRGNGWENWSRFRKEKNRVLLVTGDVVTKEEYAAISKEILNVK